MNEPAIDQPLVYSEQPSADSRVPAYLGLEVVALRSASWNQLEAWLRSIDGLRRAA